MIKKGKCSNCGLNNVNIANSKLMLCPRCNSQRLFLEKKQKQINEGVQTYTDLYKEIWAEREHVCYFTGTKLTYEIGSSLWRSCFAHIFAKGKFPKLSHLKINIVLVSPNVHHELDNGTRDSLRAKIGDNGIMKLTKLKSKIMDYYDKRNMN